jgi:hypothetical protein
MTYKRREGIAPLSRNLNEIGGVMRIATVPKLSRNLRLTSKYYEPELCHEARSKMRAHKYYAPPHKT